MFVATNSMIHYILELVSPASATQPMQLVKHFMYFSCTV